MPAWATSGQWDDALRVSHPVTFRADVWRAGQQVTIGGTPLTIPIESGQVQADETSKVRRQLTMTTGAVDLFPFSPLDTLAPVSTDLRIWAGVTFASGYTESVPVGHFRIATQSRAGLVDAMQVTGGDYAQVLAVAEFTAPWVTPPGSKVVDEIRRMVAPVLPWVTVLDLTGSSMRTVAQTFDRQRWDAIGVLTDAIGAEAFFDQVGRLVVRRVPTTANPSVWTVDSSTPRAVVQDAALAVSTDGVYNFVRVSSSDVTGPAVTAAVSQASGPFAYPAYQRPRFFSSPILRTTSQCLAAARTILARSLVYSTTVTPTTAPNPALDVGDVITLAIDGVPAGKRVLSGFTLPLGLDAMSMTLRTDSDPVSASLTTD